MADAKLEPLDETACLNLIAPGGIGRLAFAGQFDLTVLPVNYKLVDSTVLIRTAHDSTTDADLRTGIAHAERRVAFEVDAFDPAAREGWSVLVQGPAHHLDAEAEATEAAMAGLESWAGGQRDHFIRITPVRITGRRIWH
jgi:nitroimidazol reductase NimA-like FMN-containing flavoprotein (pyridoxamine 5'-phosphate oxidase superfamily)